MKQTNLRGSKLYKLHYTLIGRIVYHICKLETKQLQSMVNYFINLSKVKQKKTGKTKRKKSKKKATAKQLKARKLFAMRAKRGDFRR